MMKINLIGYYEVYTGRNRSQRQNDGFIPIAHPFASPFAGIFPRHVYAYRYLGADQKRSFMGVRNIAISRWPITQQLNYRREF